MSKPTAIVNSAGDYEESIERYAKHLGQDKNRRCVFNEIYGRARKFRSVKEIATAIGIMGGRSIQPIQNALNRLFSHDLIARHDNKGHAKDRSRYVYGKADFIRANKDEIVKQADKRKPTGPTKRRPAVRHTIPVRQVSRRDLRARKRLNVLYLTASPDRDQPLRVDAEVRKVQEAIRGSVFRDKIKIEYRPAADLNSLLDGLNDLRPQIVHFSGHGNEGGVATDTGKVRKPVTKMVSFDLLAKALNATDHPPQVVVLNSCNSSFAGKILVPIAKIVIAMQTSVTDVAATAFAQKFYAAIASGQSVNAAFKQGQIAVEAVSISETDIPVLLHAPEINPARTILT